MKPAAGRGRGTVHFAKGQLNILLKLRVTMNACEIAKKLEKSMVGIMKGIQQIHWGLLLMSR
jgi:hypothetical protein